MRKLHFGPRKKKKKKQSDTFFSLVHRLLIAKGPLFEFFGDGKYDLFWAKKLMELWYWLLKRSCFQLFGNGKYGHLWDKKLMERWYLLITDYLFWAFQRWEMQFFFSQKVDEKITFGWSFWAFHDIPGPGKYGFSRRAIFNFELWSDIFVS